MLTENVSDRGEERRGSEWTGKERKGWDWSGMESRGWQWAGKERAVRIFNWVRVACSLKM
jgi:hypothetical protein